MSLLGASVVGLVLIVKGEFDVNSGELESTQAGLGGSSTVIGQVFIQKPV